MVRPDTIREYGYVHRVQRCERDDADYFVQDNYYYICDTEETLTEQKLDDYESEENFTLEFVSPHHAIQVNRTEAHGPKDPRMLEREAKVLELLIQEGYFKNIPC